MTKTVNKTVILRGDEIYEDEVTLFAKANKIENLDRPLTELLADLEAIDADAFITVDPESRKPIKNSEKTILESIKATPNQTSKEISESTFINVKTVSNILATLFKDGKIVRSVDAKKLYRYALDGDEIKTPVESQTDESQPKDESKTENEMATKKKSATKSAAKKAAKPAKKSVEKMSVKDLTALADKFKIGDDVSFFYKKKEKDVTGKIIGRNIGKATFTVEHKDGTSYPKINAVKKA